MSENPNPTGPTRAPSPLALRFLFASMVYLFVVIVTILFGSWTSVLGRAPANAGSLMELRDLVALFGWVGLMISGVSIIVVANHWGARFRPRSLPAVHWYASNVGLAGFFVSSLLAFSVPVPAAVPAAFMSLLVLSFLVYGVGLLAALAAARPGRGIPLGMALPTVPSHRAESP